MHERIEAAFRVVLLFLVFYLTTFVGSPAYAEANPVEGKHLFKHYCAVCHGLSGKGDGINADSLGDVHPTDLTSSDIDKLDDEEIYEVIEGGGAAIDVSYFMPPWGEVFSEDQINSIIAYIRALSEEQGDPAIVAVRISGVGKKGEGKCLVCHAKENSLINPIGPNIGHEGSKWYPEALAEFLKEPGRLRPNGFMPFTKSKMPNFFFSDAEMTALVDYLMTLKDEGVQPDVLMGWDPSDPALIEEGEFLYIEEFACDGCHKRSPGGEGGIVGPELSNAMGRIRPEWVYYWLKNPQVMRPDTPMPNFKMSDDQTRSILAYLMSLVSGGSKATTVSNPIADPASVAKGQRIVEGKNCSGCHLMDSFNSQLGLEDDGLNEEAVSEEIEEE